MTNNMTAGSPLNLILQFSLPVLIGNLFQQFYAVVDSVIVGRFVGVNALAAVGSTGSLTFLVIGWITGMTSGFAILIAQYFGAGDQKQIRHYTAMSLYLCIGMAVLMTAAFLLLNVPILNAMNTPKNIMSDTRDYIAIIYAGLTATIAYNMLSGIMRALGDSKTPLYFLMLSSVINIVLDLILIVPFGMGVKGAGYATIASQGVSAILCFFYMKGHYSLLRFGREDAVFSWKSFRKLMEMGIPMGLQFSITAIGTIMVQVALNSLGAVYIAAFSAASKIQSFVCQPMISLGVTMATYVGQNSGAGRMDRVKDGVRLCFKLSVLVGVVCTILIFFFGDTLVRIFISEGSQEVIHIAREYFMICIWFYVPLSLIFLYRNTLQGLGDGLFPMLGGLFELGARCLAILLLAKPLGFAGICMADPFAWILALIPIVPVYYSRMKKISRSSV